MSKDRNEGATNIPLTQEQLSKDIKDLTFEINPLLGGKLSTVCVGALINLLHTILMNIPNPEERKDLSLFIQQSLDKHIK